MKKSEGLQQQLKSLSFQFKRSKSKGYKALQSDNGLKNLRTSVAKISVVHHLGEQKAIAWFKRPLEMTISRLHSTSLATASMSLTIQFQVISASTRPVSISTFQIQRVSRRRQNASSRRKRRSMSKWMPEKLSSFQGTERIEAWPRSEIWLTFSTKYQIYNISIIF